MSVWFTSDLHFCHDKEFLYGPRGFTNVGDMNEELIKKWNDVVTTEDIVYVLGDLMLNNDEKALRCIERLNGTLHIILGNHDTENRISFFVTILQSVVILMKTIVRLEQR